MSRAVFVFLVAVDGLVLLACIAGAAYLLAWAP